MASPQIDTVKATSFVRPKFTLHQAPIPDPKNILNLPDLVEFNAQQNPDHPFCLQYHHNVALTPRRITMSELQDAVLRCSVWLIEQGMAQTPTMVEGKLIKAPPVAVLMSSDVGWFIYFLALLRIGVPVLCMSARLSPQAVVHLILATKTRSVLVSPQLESLASEAMTLFEANREVAWIPSFRQAPSYALFVHAAGGIDPRLAPPANRIVDPRDRNVVILHSSGTTGLPKPIYHTHAYLLGYAACHKLSERDVEGAMNVSTLPLFHGFGLLAPTLSLSIGLPFAIPAATTIPTGTSTYEIIKSAKATSLLTVPSILEEIYLLEDGKGVGALLPLRFVAVGGAAMKLSVAEPLVAAGVPILNHSGVTELGAIAPITIPAPDYDFHYLRLREDLNLRLEHVDKESGMYRLIGLPLGSDTEFVVQDLLTTNPNNPGKEFKILGRADDLIVLATGEKVRPTLLEQHVSENPLVKGAVCFGEGRFQLGLLIEAAPNVTLDPTDKEAVSAYLDTIWPSVALGNDHTDNHGRVTRGMIVVTTPTTRPLIRTPKGSIPRNDNMKLFKDEIEEVYAMADMADAKVLPLEDEQALKAAISEAVHASFTIPRTISAHDDFFERGMDSLQATMLRRRVNASVILTLTTAGLEPRALPSDFIYANPSITRLCDALKSYLVPGSDVALDRVQNIRNVASEYVQKVNSLTPSPSDNIAADRNSVIVLLTGSTGSLGSAMLSELALSPSVTKVIGLNRSSSQDVYQRQAAAFDKIGVKIDEQHWSKILLLEGDLSLPKFGQDDETYAELRGVTHIIHNAWPMDFNRSLTSFRPHLDASQNIIQLSLDSVSPLPVRILFSSSIAVVGRYPIIVGNDAPILERPLEEPEAIDHFGYAEAKWVCEKMFEQASKTFSDKLVASIVRIGQLTGPEATGAWNTSEHLPMMMKSAVSLGCMPQVDGHASWIPANRASKVMTELLFSQDTAPTYHLENPARQPWSEALEILASALGLSSKNTVPFAEWLQKVQAKPDAAVNPCVKIIPFLEDEFLRMATGKVVLDTAVSTEVSPTLKSSQPLNEDDLRRYVAYWRSLGFLG